MANHHPDDGLLFEYAAGSLNEAKSLLVATHLALCPSCRLTVEDAESISSVLAMQSGEFAAVADLALPLPQPEAPAAAPVSVPVPSGSLPQPLRRYIGQPIANLPWRRAWFGMKSFDLPQFSGSNSVRLLCIEPGRRMPRHTHEGEELTLVLKGSFADSTGTYRAGDVATADLSVDHQPRAGVEEDCICLAVEDAPFRMTGLVGRVIESLPRLPAALRR